MVKKITLTIIRRVCIAGSLLFLVFYLSACSKDDNESIESDSPKSENLSLTEELVFAEAGASSIDIEVTADENKTWSVDKPLQEWLNVESSTTKGNGKITLQLEANIKNQPRQCYVLVRCNYNKYYIDVNQQKGINVAPDKPEYLFPVANASAVNPYPVFSWKVTPDQNDDKVSYTISYSKDQANWTTSEPFDKLTYDDKTNAFDRLTYYISDKLEENTTYYWYVTVADAGGLQTKGEIRSFTTGNPIIPADGSWTIYPGSENGVIPLVFLGDGFIPSDYVEGGDFDKKLNQGIEYFFNAEPYKSYREYFKIYKLVSYSREQGASVHDGDAQYPHIVDVDTRFKVRFNGNGYNNTQMTFGDTGNGEHNNNIPAVFNFVKTHIPAIDDKVLLRTTVVVVANYWLYGGTCWWTYTDENGQSDWNGSVYTGHDGTAVTIVPTCEQGRDIPWMNPSGNHYVYYSYEATMHHEAGGHGFGRLADEYKYGWYPAGAWEISGINNGTQHGYNGNIDVTNDPARVKWKAFFSTDAIKARYPQVGIYEGAQYTKNVYMSETTPSCMNNMATPQSAVSREVIVRKIYKALNAEYSFDLFMQKDKADPVTTGIRSARTNHSGMGIAHTPPQIVNQKEIRK